jgi:hypothetical protein
VGTLKHKFLQYITIKNVLVLFHYQNNFEINSSSAIWWRHLAVACNNFFEAGVSGNRLGAQLSRRAVVCEEADRPKANCFNKTEITI